MLTYSPWLKVCGEDVLVLLMVVVRELRRGANMSYRIRPHCPGIRKGKKVLAIIVSLPSVCVAHLWTTLQCCPRIKVFLQLHTSSRDSIY